MPLLTTNQTINAEIAKLAHDMAAHLSAAAQKSNRIAEMLTDQEPEVLESWLNEFGADAFALFSSHKTTGDALNAISDEMTAAMAPQGVEVKPRKVDVRPFEEKLVGKGKKLVIDKSTGRATVTKIEETELIEP